jgi:hypothetical protein
MHMGERRLLVGGALIGLALAAVLGSVENRPAARAAEADQVEYTFGSAIQ